MIDKNGLSLLAKKIYDYCGLNYLDNENNLYMKIEKRLKLLNIKTIQDYKSFLLENECEWEPLIECLTINETYFYREEKQLNIFSNKIYKQFLLNQTSPIKVWSAACSTGEEAYSILMNTLDVDSNATNHIEIEGTDITNSVITSAKRGSYFKKSLTFRRIPTDWRRNYFIEEANTFLIKKEIKDCVEFKYGNLLEVDNFPIEEYDVIFCRNVLIYFDESTIEKIVNGFYKALKQGGVLFLGHAEMISKLNTQFHTINDNGTFYYRKE